MVAAVIPALLLYPWHQVRSAAWGWAVAGALLAACGLYLLATTIALLARVGRGTLTPWDPTTRLVVTGIYRHTRNPMITGVMAVLLGEALVTGARPLFYWFLFFVCLNVTYIPLLEEPGLEKRFGVPYRVYKANVPRWIPRLRPWNG